MKNSVKELQEQSIKIINHLHTYNSIKILCKDGEVIINEDRNFTYVGKFGRLVSSHIIKNGLCENLTQKIIVLSAYMIQYSKNVGGFNISHLNN